MSALLIRYLPYIIGALAIIGACWYVVSAIHTNGRQVERAEWLEKEKKQQEEIAKELGEAMQRVADENSRNLNNTMRVIDERDQAINKLESDMRAQRAANRGLWISAEACRNNDSTHGQTEGTSKPGDSERIRLPGDVERRLRELAETAQRLAIGHNACVAALAPLVEVVDR